MSVKHTIKRVCNPEREIETRHYRSITRPLGQMNHYSWNTNVALCVGENHRAKAFTLCFTGQDETQSVSQQVSLCSRSGSYEKLKADILTLKPLLMFSHIWRKRGKNY